MSRRLAALALLFAALGGADPSADLNDAVVRFCEDRMGTQVGSGGCEAVAAEALAAAGASTRGWGERVERPLDARPGDVVEFRGAQFVIRSPNGTRHLRTAERHVAVVARNRGDGRFDVYEQNVVAPGATAARRAKLRKGMIDLTGLLRGEVTFYRPAGSPSP